MAELAERNLQLEFDFAIRNQHIARINSSFAWTLTAPIRAIAGPSNDPGDWRRAFRERLLFRRSGRPVKAVRRALFHTSGKPRGAFRKWVLSDDGFPRPAFRIWMESDAYRNLPSAFKTDGLVEGTPLRHEEKNPVRHEERGEKGRWRAAIVAPVSASGSTGGAERLYRGLTRALRELGYDIDLLTIPFDELTFEKIQAGYNEFEAMELAEYDLVISTKAPSYCIKHDNHVLYLMHTIRVFYEEIRL